MNPNKRRITNRRKLVQYRGTECLNCGHPLDVSDLYCPRCSQMNSRKKLSIVDFFMEFLGSIVVYDSRLRTTLKDLLFRPGVITRNYVKGQRLKYANPFRFFLSVSIIYFLINGFLDVVNPKTEATNGINFNAKLADRAFVDSHSQNIAQSTSKPFNLADSLKKMNTPKEIEYFSEADLAAMPFAERYSKRFSLYHDFYEKHQIKNAEVALDSLHHRNTSFNRWVYSKNTTVEKIKENPSAFIRYILSKIPFFLFFFTPFFAFFFWISYSKKRHTYMEHMIFIFHIFSFIFLAMLLLLLPDLLLNTKFFVSCLFIFVGPLYFYKALRNFYGQGRLITIIKFVFLNTVFVIGLSLAATLFIAASAAIY